MRTYNFEKSDKLMQRLEDVIDDIIVDSTKNDHKEYEADANFNSKRKKIEIHINNFAAVERDDVSKSPMVRKYDLSALLRPKDDGLWGCETNRAMDDVASELECLAKWYREHRIVDDDGSVFPDPDGYTHPKK